MNYKVYASKLDKTIKITFEQGYSAVLIPQKTGTYTLCLSTQIGCPIGCKFCHSGKYKFEKNLSPQEIVEQFETAIQVLNIQNPITKQNTKGNHIHKTIYSIVFMGMGEPLLNYDNLISACDIFNSKYLYPYSKITISTSGIIPKLKELIEQPRKIQLAISLHSPFQEIREKLIPIAKQNPIQELIKLTQTYNKKHKKKKMMIEYLMIAGLTDRDQDLNEILSFNLDKMTNFNLIPLNTSFKLENTQYSSSDIETIEKFKKALVNAGYKSFMRNSAGKDLDAACGMLKKE